MFLTTFNIFYIAYLHIDILFLLHSQDVEMFVEVVSLGQDFSGLFPVVYVI